MARRVRCGKCRELYDPDEQKLTPVGRDRYCAECLPKVLDDELDARDDDEPVNAYTPNAESARIASHFVTGTLVDAPPETRVTLEPDRELIFGRTSYDETPGVPGWPLRRGRLSASALATFERCPEQFRRKYVKGEREPRNSKLVLGSAVHAALQANWLHRLAHGENGDPGELRDFAREAFDREISEAGGTRWIEWGDDDENEWRTRAGVVVSEFVRHIAPSIDPIAVEQPFAIRVAGCPVPVVGKIDLREASGITDVKVGKNLAKTITPDWRIQARLYAAATRLPVSYVTGNYAGNFQTPLDHPALRLRYDSAALATAMLHVRRDVAAIIAFAETFGPDDVWPGAVIHTWACGTCAFQPECAWWHPRVDSLL